METLSEVSGFVASTLVLFTFVAKDMCLLRTIAIFSNLAFITYGTIEWLPPVLYLHLVLLPLNIIRLTEIMKASRATGDLVKSTVAADCGARPRIAEQRSSGYDRQWFVGAGLAGPRHRFSRRYKTINNSSHEATAG